MQCKCILHNCNKYQNKTGTKCYLLLAYGKLGVLICRSVIVIICVAIISTSLLTNRSSFREYINQGL